jgi:hypothetical protein
MKPALEGEQGPSDHCKTLLELRVLPEHFRQLQKRMNMERISLHKFHQDLHVLRLKNFNEARKLLFVLLRAAKLKTTIIYFFQLQVVTNEWPVFCFKWDSQPEFPTSNHRPFLLFV